MSAAEFWDVCMQGEALFDRETVKWKLAPIKAPCGVVLQRLKATDGLRKKDLSQFLVEQ